MKRKEVLARVFQMPFFGGLKEATRKRVSKALRIERVGPGTCFVIEEDDSPPELFLVVQGEVAISVEDRLLVLNQAPLALSLLSVVDDAPRTASITAFSDVVYAAMSQDDFRALMASSPRFARNVIDYLTHDVRELHHEDDRIRQHFDDHFDSPNARLVPGPYAMEDVDLRVFVMHGPRSAQARLLPPGLSPLPGAEDRWLLISGFFPRVYSLHPSRHAQPTAYAETAPYLPCLGPNGKPALFCVEAYPDNYMAIFLGRELYGFPRRFGQTRLAEQHLDLAVDGRMVLRASWGGSAPLAPTDIKGAVADALPGGPTQGADRLAVALSELMGTSWPVGKGPALPVLVRNQIPDVQQSDGDLLRVDELISLPLRVSEVGAVERLEAPQVRRFAHDWMLGGRCHEGFRLRMTLTLGHAERLRSYLSQRRLRWLAT